MKSYVNPKTLSPPVKKAARVFRALTTTIRLVPDFLIIGAARCGTTSFYRYLTEHPCIAPAFRKEVDFFDRHFGKGLSWYRKHFPSIFFRRYSKARYGCDGLTGEASPYYIFHPLSAARVATMLPRVKLIALLRNPVDRAYSHYHLQVCHGREPLSFEDAILREQERLKGEQNRILTDGDYHSYNYQRYSYVSRGLYVDQLARWLNLFPKDSLLVVRTEDLDNNPAAVLKHTLRFLNLPEWEPKRFAKYNGGSYPMMKHETRRRLIEYFEPHNQRLRDLVGKELDWDR
jgi:hypothetical protein